MSFLGKNLPPREFYERLLEMKRICREVKRIIELREDVINEKLDELEHQLEEAKILIEAGFEYVCDFNGAKMFRKRK